jgi:hypothetical protein
MSRIPNRKPDNPAPSAPPGHPLAADGPGRQPKTAVGTPTPRSDGRDAEGRFARGNPGGPGNPFTRQVAALRKQLLGALTEEDLKAVSAQLVRQARAGDLAAIELLFGYVLGRPKSAVNPDTLDHAEMQQYRRELGMEALVVQVGQALTPEIACQLLSVVRPLLLSRIVNALAEKLPAGLPLEYRQPDGGPGTDPECADTRPSSIGDNGEGDAAKKAE